METSLDEAVIMISKLTNRVSNIIIFSVVIVVLFILGPFSITRHTAKFIKLIIAIMLGITLYTNYVGIDNIKDKFEDELRNNESWSTINTHMTYSYIHSILLGIFIVFLLYTCI